MLHRDGVFDVHDAAPLRKVVPQDTGLDIHAQLAERRLVQRGMLASLFKNHHGIDGTGASRS